MCRFTLYLGQPIRLDHLITEPENSLIHQSYESQEREEPLNGDGFGVAFYVPEVSPEPAVFRSISPAWSNRNLQQIARVTRSPCVLAHVRAATPGSAVAEANCHPFVHGKYAFMHNGHLAGFRQWRRTLLGRLSDEAFQLIEGSTDSEHMFALFVDRLHALGDGGAAAMAAALRGTLADLLALAGQHGVTEPSYLNVAASDGQSAVISRFTTDAPENADSLYYHIGKRYTSVGGFTAMIEAQLGRGSVLVSSERLSDDPGWEPVPVNHLVIVHHERRVELEPV